MKLIGLAYPSIEYVAAVEATDEEVSISEVNGVTIRNVTAGTEGSPERFDVNFMVQFSHEVAGQKCLNTFHFGTNVPGKGLRATYAEVEEAAAQQLPSLLRELADAIEEDNQRVLRNRADRSSPVKA